MTAAKVAMEPPVASGEAGAVHVGPDDQLVVPGQSRQSVWGVGERRPVRDRPGEALWIKDWRYGLGLALTGIASAVRALASTVSIELRPRGTGMADPGGRHDHYVL